MQQYVKNKAEEQENDYADSLHQARWKSHKHFGKSRDELVKMCLDNKLNPDDTKSKPVERLANKLSLPEPPLPETFDGNLADIPTTVAEISKLSIFKLKQILRYYNVHWVGT